MTTHTFFTDSEYCQVSAPAEVDALIDRATQNDKKFFEDNPDRCICIRSYVPGETWPVDSNVAYTVVIRLTETSRIREFITATELSTMTAQKGIFLSDKQVSVILELADKRTKKFFESIK
jgi:hypothetical protein